MIATVMAVIVQKHDGFAMWLSPTGRGAGAANEIV
jgi:hypothetical protein